MQNKHKKRTPAYTKQAEEAPYALAVRKAGNGFGIFALEEIPKGEYVLEYTGEIITDEEADRRESKYLIDAEDGWVIDGTGRENFARYINHRCKPNCEAVAEGKRVFIYTTRRIKPGEELGYDYGKDYINFYFGRENCCCPTCQEKKGAESVA